MSPVCMYMYLYLTVNLGNFILQRVGSNWLQSFESAILYCIQNKNFVHIFQRVPCLLFATDSQVGGHICLNQVKRYFLSASRVMSAICYCLTVHICKDFHANGER